MTVVENKFKKTNATWCGKDNDIYLREEGEILSLMLKDSSGLELMHLGILPISEKKKITNFFQRGFHLSLENTDELTIPINKLMEKERKIIVPKEKETLLGKARIQLQEIYEGKINRSIYQRTIIYMDTSELYFSKKHMIFRLTEEENTVKVTIHFNNHLPGDEKYIAKFFCNHTDISEVITFFEQALGLIVITKPFLSKREEWRTYFGEVAIDDMGTYSVIELELDSFAKTNDTSSYINEKAKEITENLGLATCEVVDCGTEEIYERKMKIPFFESFKIKDKDI